MLEENERQALRKGMTTVWTIWAALLVSSLIYVLLSHLMRMRGMLPISKGADFVGALKNILYAAAVAQIFLIRYLRKKMLTIRPGSLLQQRVKATSNAKPTLPPSLGKYTAASIVCWAIAGSIAIYGFVLCLLGAGFKTLYIFVAISIITMFYYRPKMDELQELASATKSIQANYEEGINKAKHD